MDDLGVPGNHHIFKYSYITIRGVPYICTMINEPEEQCMYLCNRPYVFQHRTSHDHVNPALLNRWGCLILKSTVYFKSNHMQLQLTAIWNS